MPNLVVIKRGHSPEQIRNLIRTTVADALSTPGQELVIDLTDLDVITSAILKALLRTPVLELASQQRIRVHTATQEVTQVLSAYRLSTLFNLQQGEKR